MQNAVEQHRGPSPDAAAPSDKKPRLTLDISCPVLGRHLPVFNSPAPMSKQAHA